MIDPISRRIQARLARKGIFLSLPEIKEEVGGFIPDPANPSHATIDLSALLDLLTHALIFKAKRH